MELQQINELILENLEDFSNILPHKHRVICIATNKYLATLPRTKTIELQTITPSDRFYKINPQLVEGNFIINVVPYLYCRNSNSGYITGDIVSMPHIATNYGITFQYNTADLSTIAVAIDGIIQIKSKITEPFVPNSSVTSVDITPFLADWSLRVVITYGTAYQEPVNP